MRYVVHAEHHHERTEFAFSTAAEAVANDTYEAYFPDEFVRLFKMTAAVTHEGRKQR